MSEPLFSLLLPTRKRPHFMHRLVVSACGAMAAEDLEIIFYIDDDDQESITELAVLQSIYQNVGIKGVIGPRIVLSQAWNECYKVSTGRYLMHCGDDIIFRTLHWDAIVNRAFETIHDDIAFVYGRDGIQGPTFGTHGFLSRRAVEVIGYFMPPYFSSDYNDTWWNDVYERIGRKIYVPDLLTEHMHFCVGKHFKDQTTLDRLERHQADNMDQVYQAHEPERVVDTTKLQAAICGF